MWRFIFSNPSGTGIQLELFTARMETVLSLPLHSDISAGFPLPANDFVEQGIDLNEELIRHPSTTFLVRVKGHSMVNAGIADRDLLVVDRTLQPSTGAIALCCIDGEFTVKRLRIEKECCWLIPENDDYEPMCVTQENDFSVIGIVVHCIKSF
jgi:DNA polymerase V